MVEPDLVPLIRSLGYIGIFSAILFENGIPLFFFLPADSLLLTAGFIAAHGYLHIEILVLGGFITAVFGYMLGYFLGHHTGLRIFRDGESRWIKREHYEKTKDFYRKYGKLSLLLARFVPLRAWVCFLAGMTQMNYRTFMIYNILGALAWGVALPLIGYYLGTVIPVDNLKELTLVPVICVAFTVIVIPALFHWYQSKKKKS